MFKVGDKVMVVECDEFLCGKIGTIHTVDDNFEYPYGVSGDDFNFCFNDTEIILMEVNPIYSIYGFYAAVIASMSGLWLLFDVIGKGFE